MRYSRPHASYDFLSPRCITREGGQSSCLHLWNDASALLHALLHFICDLKALGVHPTAKLLDALLGTNLLLLLKEMPSVNKEVSEDLLS